MSSWSSANVMGINVLYDTNQDDHEAMFSKIRSYNADELCGLQEAIESLGGFGIDGESLRAFDRVNAADKSEFPVLLTDPDPLIRELTKQRIKRIQVT